METGRPTKFAYNFVIGVVFEKALATTYNVTFQNIVTALSVNVSFFHKRLFPSLKLRHWVPFWESRVSGRAN